MIKVMIDPGHAPGNANKGANGFYEHAGMWNLSIKLKALLEKQGIAVELTRSQANDVSLTDRGNKAKGCDVFISQHSNAANKTARGVECFYSLRRGSDKTWANCFSKDLSIIMNNNDRGAKTKIGENGGDYFTVIRAAGLTDCKHIFLVENGFHDNLVDEAFLLLAENIDKIAIAQAKIICEIVGLKYTEKETTSLHKIMGKPVIDKNKFIVWWEKQAIKPKLNCSFVELVNLFYEIGEIEGVRADFALCQAIHETGKFQFGGLVLPGQNNYSGLGATDSTKVGGANSFLTPRDGVTAQIQHLKGYASVEGLKLACKDLRYKYINPLGSCPYLEWLSIPNNPIKKGWASDKGYFQKIMGVFDNVYNTVEKAMTVEMAISKLVDAKKISNPEYWIANYNKLLYLDVLLINIAKAL